MISETAILLFALQVSSWLVEDRSRIRLAFRTIVVTGTVVSIYGISQYFGWDLLLPSRAYQSGEGIFTIVRPPGTFGHADYFANWLLIVAFCALALDMQEDDGRWKTTARVTLMLTIFTILLSGTRSALFGLLVGAIVFITIARPRLNQRVLLSVVASLVGLGLLYISPPGAKLRARVHWSMEDVRGGARMLLWRDSFNMAVRRPILGFGPETYSGRFPLFASVELSKAYPDFYRESPHNMFLDTLTSSGIPGALSMLALCALGCWTARRNPALAGGLAGAIVCQQFVVFTIPTALYFYLLISVAIAGGIAPRRFEPKRFPLILAPLAAAIAITFLAIAIRLLVADRAMAVTEQRATSGDIQGAAAAYRIVQRWEPPRGDSDLRYSRAMIQLAITSSSFSTSVAAAQEASKSAIRATTTAEDRQNAWYNLATIAALRDDRDGAEHGLRQAIVCAPNWFKPHWALARVLEVSGRHSEARREASIAMDLDGGHDPAVAETSKKILNLP